MKKRILIPIIAVLSVASLSSYGICKTNAIKDVIKNQVLNEINNSQINNEESQNNQAITASALSNQLQSSRMISLDSSYKINVDNIYNEKLSKKKIDNNNYLNYTFDAEISFSKNKKTYKKIINSSVIVEKTDGAIKIKSIYELEQSLIETLIKIKKENFEDISEELSNISLIYQNEELDIQISYPNYYTYNALKTDNENSIEHNVSFYIDNNKTSNYIQFAMLQKKSKENENYIDKLKSQGYTLKKNTLLNPNGLEFTILTQSFTQNYKDITEIIYVSNSKYKDIESIIITAKLDSALLQSRKSEIEELIKSLK